MSSNIHLNYHITECIQYIILSTAERHWVNYLNIHICFLYAASRGAVSGLDGETKNQNVWLQVSPYPRPTYGYIASAMKFVAIRNFFIIQCIKTVNAHLTRQ